MDEPWPDIAAAYDAAAADYADLFGAELAGKPFDRELLDRFAAAVAGRGPVWDVGCGSAGHVTRYLADRGVEAAGADLSPGAVAQARQRQPDLTFHVADLRALPVPGGSLAGITAFYSVIHLPRPQLPVAMAEFRRALVPGGSALIAMHGGAGELDSAEAFGHRNPLRATLVSLAELAAVTQAAGLTVDWQHEREPYPSEHATPRVYLWARRPQ